MDLAQQMKTYLIYVQEYIIYQSYLLGIQHISFLKLYNQMSLKFLSIQIVYSVIMVILYQQPTPMEEHYLIHLHGAIALQISAQY